jgi:hypothetical protein
LIGANNDSIIVVIRDMRAMTTYEVTLGAEADSFEETFRIRATFPKAAEFDAKHEAAQRYPFMDPSDFVVLSVRTV